MKQTARTNPLFLLAGTFLFLGIWASTAIAHPLTQGSLDVVVHPDHVAVRASVTVEEVDVTNMLAPSAPSTPGGAGAADEPFRRHAAYLASHLRVTADGRVLAATVRNVVPSAKGGTQSQRATYELEYREVAAPAAPADAAKPPARIELLHSVLTDVEFLPGVKWEASYIVRIRQPNRPAAEGLLLVAGKPIGFDCNWSDAAADGASAAGTVDHWRMAGEFLNHGIHHILTGYDHLLFISALVLATRRLWDLVKVVSAFTLAHTITLALAALNWVHLPARVVEPMIALSIVVVALQNVLWPEQSRGWKRLTAAFFFGLFHGLGFAGGLIEAMQQMPVASMLLAIATFSLGVEIGHQMIVVPLFAGLKLARRARVDESGRERLSLAAQRFGSAAISLAGMAYLYIAIWGPR